MNTTTRDRLKNRKRTARVVAIAGADALHVHDLTLSELREIDRRAEDLPAGQEREIRRVELTALYALAEADGTRTFPDRAEADLDAVAWLTAAELRAIADACVPSSADAKKG